MLGNPNFEEFALASVTFSMRHFVFLTKGEEYAMLFLKRFKFALEKEVRKGDRNRSRCYASETLHLKGG